MKKLFVVLLSLTLIVGCAKTGSSESENGMKTVETVMGDVEVPVEPKRVVVNWYTGDAIALELNIVGFFSWNHETMPFHETLNNINQIEKWEPEEVMALEPDLIITYQEEDFSKFGKIAPVVVLKETDYNSLERVIFLGEVTGRQEQAKKAVDSFNEKLNQAKETMKADVFEGKTFSIMEDWGPTGEWSGVYYETGSRGGTLVYTYLGLNYPEKLGKLMEDTHEGRGSLSYEVAHEYFGDYIIWFQQEGKESEYAKTEIWKSIPAVKEGNVVEVPGEMLGLFYYSDVLSLTAQLDYMVDALNTFIK